MKIFWKMMAKRKARKHVYPARQYIRTHMPESCMPQSSMQFCIADDDDDRLYTPQQPVTKYSLPPMDPLKREILEWQRKNGVGQPAIKPVSSDDLVQEYRNWQQERKSRDSFRTALLRKIEESGMKAAAFYKKAGIDRKLFSRIRTDTDYQPNKKTAIRCCMALELNLKQTDELLRHAGYALSDSSQSDLAIRYCIENRIYDLMEVDMLLYMLGLSIL